MAAVHSPKNAEVTHSSVVVSFLLLIVDQKIRHCNAKPGDDL